jgi:hypothetical protein
MTAALNDLLVGPVTPSNGVSVISLDFFIESSAHIEVYSSAGGETPLSLGADYTVSGVGTSTGSITLTTPADGSTTYAVFYVQPAARTTDLAFRGGFSSAAVNDELDRIVRIAQYVTTQVRRVFRVGSTDDVIDPIPLTPNKIMATNGSGVPAFDIDRDAVDNIDANVDAAEASATAAAASAAAASGSAGDASGFADEAETTVGYSAEWANKAEDSLVSVAAGGDGVDDYSAKHWSNKAQGYAAGLNVPSISTGDAGKVLTANAAETGYENRVAFTELTRWEPTGGSPIGDFEVEASDFPGYTSFKMLLSGITVDTDTSVGIEFGDGAGGYDTGAQVHEGVFMGGESAGAVNVFDASNRRLYFAGDNVAFTNPVDADANSLLSGEIEISLGKGAGASATWRLCYRDTAGDLVYSHGSGVRYVDSVLSVDLSVGFPFRVDLVSGNFNGGLAVLLGAKA